MKHYNMSSLVGKTMLSAFRTSAHGEDGIEFRTETGELWVVMHAQSCCENVTIEDITGDLQDLVGAPIVMAECVTKDGNAADAPPPPLSYSPESSTWSFCKFATAKGYVTVRFFGTSNGYYGETADLFGPERYDA